MTRVPRVRIPVGDALDADIEREASRIPVPDQRPEGRCRICQSAESRDRVNKFLAYGMSPTEIVALVKDINEKRPKNNRISYWSIYHHSKRHFDVQDPAQAAYRRILDRRAREHAENYTDGVTNLLTTYGFLEVIAQKGYENLIDPDTVVDFTEGVKASIKLHELTRNAGDQETAELRRQVGLLQQVVMEEADAATRTRIVSRLDEISGRNTEDVLDVDYDEDDEEEASPMNDIDAEDPLVD